MKKQIFTFIAMLSTLIAAEIQGSEWDFSDCGYVYVGGFAGVNFLQKDKGPGFAGGISLGYKLPINYRLEGEFSYRRNVLNKSFNRNHKVEKYAAMANLLYDFDFCSNWKPYIGFGIGYGWIEYSFKRDFYYSPVTLVYKDRGFAFQGITGIAYAICEKTDLGLEYRYFQAKSYVKNHAVTLSVRRSF